MDKYYVSKENTIGQVTWSAYDSKEEFDAWYAGKMKDGSNDLIKDVYPTIHYQGLDMDECMRINEERARQNYSHPLTPFIHLIADGSDMKSAEALYAEVKTPQ